MKYFILLAFLNINYGFSQTQNANIIVKTYTNEDGEIDTKSQEFYLNDSIFKLNDSIQTINHDSEIEFLNDFEQFFKLIRGTENIIPKPYLGIVFQEINNGDNIDKSSSIEVTSIMPNSAAEVAGIQVGDKILTIDNEKAINLPQIVQKVQQKGVGDILKLTIERNGTPIMVEAKLTARTNNDHANVYNWSENQLEKRPPCEHMPMPKFQMQRPNPRLGITVESLDDEIRKDLKMKKGNGIIVTEIVAGSNADQAGIKLNDIILSINDIPVTSPLEVKQGIKCMPFGSDLKISIKRYGKKKILHAILNEVTENWDENITDQEMEFNVFPNIYLFDEQGNKIIIPFSPEEKMEMQKALDKTNSKPKATEKH